MSEQYLTRREICEALSISRSTFYRQLTLNPNFPKPIQISAACKRYRESELEQFIEGLRSGSKNGEADDA